jgi:hypothetical protein
MCNETLNVPKRISLNGWMSNANPPCLNTITKACLVGIHWQGFAERRAGRKAGVRGRLASKDEPTSELPSLYTSISPKPMPWHGSIQGLANKRPVLHYQQGYAVRLR